jgi:hypothetical protein
VVEMRAKEVVGSEGLKDVIEICDFDGELRVDFVP